MVAHKNSIPIFPRPNPGGNYHVRRTIPSDLQRYFPKTGGGFKTELSAFNLKTKDEKVALVLGAKVWAEHKAMLETISNPVPYGNGNDARAAFVQRYTQELINNEQQRLDKAAAGIKKLNIKIRETELLLKREHDEAIRTRLNHEQERYKNLRDELEYHPIKVRNDLRKLNDDINDPDFFDVFTSEAQDYLRATGAPTIHTEQIASIARQVATTVIAETRKVFDESDLTTLRAPSPPPAVNSTSTSPDITLSRYYETIFKEFQPVKKAQGELGTMPNSYEKYEEGVSAFVDIMGDMKLAEIEPRHIQEFIDVYSKVPNHWSKRNEYKGIPLRELALIANSSEEPVPRKAPATVNSMLTGLRGVFKLAKKRFHVQTNPVAGMNVDEPKDIIREPAFRMSELNRLFRSPQFTGALNDKQLDTPGTHLIRDHRFWAHFVMLLSGLRVSEAGGIRTDQVIIKEEDMGHFVVTWTTGEGGRSLKNGPSTRNVPIHPILFRLGFREYVSSMRGGGHERLFPGWKPNLKKSKAPGVEGTYHYSSSDWIKKLGRTQIWREIKGEAGRERLSLKSYRATFEEASYGTSVNERTALAMTGRAHPVQSMNHYKGNRFNDDKLKGLQEAIEQYRFDGLDISHLFVR